MPDFPASLYTSNPTFSNQTDQIALFSFKGSITQDPRILAPKSGRARLKVSEIGRAYITLYWQFELPQKLNIFFNTFQREIPSNLSLSLDLRIIHLSHNDLVGKIPAAFGSLSKLASLFLMYNNLHGTIPPSLGNLSLLKTLSLGTNNLEGTIPESIGHL
ncbi:hypothetical protein QYF36_008247 [Acer negundo]|nr:hypothetical protein QYF36_008247 [Acer negundo]